MQKLRKLPFFDRRVVQVDSGGAEPPFEKLQLTCSGGGKYLWFGSTDGNVHCLHHNFALRSFQAFEGQVDHIVEFTDAHVLAVGGSGGGGQPGGARVEEKFEKYFGYLARCEGKILYIDPQKTKFGVEME